MSVFLVVPIVLANALLTLRDSPKGVLLYAGLAFLLPHPVIAGASVPYEMLALPAVFLAAIYVHRRLRHPTVHILVASYLALVLLSTIVGTTVHGTDLSAVRVLGFLRVLVLISLLCETLDRRSVETLLLVVLAVNAAIGFAQLIVPGGAQLTLQLWGREGGTVLEQYAEWGNIPRASGTFTSPIILASVALMGLAVAWAGILTGGRDWGARYRWLLVASAVAGILTLTKTFILGAPAVLIGGLGLRALLIASARSWRPRSALGVLAVALVGFGVTLWIGRYLAGLGLPVGYYVGFLAEPLAAFGGRYGPGGQLEAAAAVVGENLVLGVGLTRVGGEFLGDSLYVSILHATGLVGALFALGVLGGTISRYLSLRSIPGLLLLFVILLSGTAIDIVFRLPGALAIAYLVSLPDEHEGE